MVIGSGLGGLCCAGLLARYGQDVLVLESHDLPGGAAHSFEIKDYKFDSGPSLFSGFQSRGPQANPLAQVLILLLYNLLIKIWLKLLGSLTSRWIFSKLRLFVLNKLSCSF